VKDPPHEWARLVFTSLPVRRQLLATAKKISYLKLAITKHPMLAAQRASQEASMQQS
jgi:hypothetical protein